MHREMARFHCFAGFVGPLSLITHHVPQYNQIQYDYHHSLELFPRPSLLLSLLFFFLALFRLFKAQSLPRSALGIRSVIIYDLQTSAAIMVNKQITQ